MPNTIGPKTKATEIRVNATNYSERRSSWILEDELNVQIARLKDQNVEDLRVRWRKLFRAPAPPHLSRPRLLRIIRHRMQADAFSELNREPFRHIN